MMRLGFILGVVLVASSCGDSDATTPATSATGSPTASVPPTAPSSSAPYRDDDLPVAPDYEAEAEKAVTAKNYKDKLSEVEEELGVPAASASAAASDEELPPPSPSLTGGESSAHDGRPPLSR